MKSTLMALSVILSAFSLAFGSNEAVRVAELPNGARYIVNRVIVVNEYGAPAYLVGESASGMAVTGVTSVDLLCQRLGVIDVQSFYAGRLTKPALLREVSRMYIFTLQEGVDARSVLAEFNEEPNIAYAELYAVPEPCYVPNDPRASDQWYLAQTQAYQGWDTVRGDTTRHSVIAIVDSGVYWNHPDLAPNIWLNPGEDIDHDGVLDPEDINGVDDDSNGFVDDIIGWDFGDDDYDPVENTLQHGTAVAGCASEATDNGLLGAAIGFSARLMCVKVFDFSGNFANAYQGIIYAAENGAEAINCSWATLSYSQAEQDIISAAWAEGSLIVAAAGNANGEERFPAAYDHVMAVTTTDQNDRKASFANYGTWVDISAPGVDIYTTYGQSGFVLYSGASFSTAMVSGLVALVRAWLPQLTNDETEDLIKAYSDPIDYLNPGYGGLLGAGRINCATWLVSGITDLKTIPGQFAISQNYPNPFNATTTIRYELPTASDVAMQIFDVAGRKVATLVSECQEAGPHFVTWDASKTPSGVYFYRIQAGAFIETKMCLLLK